MSEFDVVILTESRYENPTQINDYIKNVLTEDSILQKALEDLGLVVIRKDWADPEFNWANTKCAVFRSTWDYFDRFSEFKSWLERVESLTTFVNPISQIKWNMDKWYLQDLSNRNINTVETRYISRGETKSLDSLINETGWKEVILKPTIAGAARHTYRVNIQTISEYEDIFRELISNEDMMLQPFQHNIMKKGEISFMVIGGKFTHAVLKKGKAGDFRVQDDFGGTLHEYHPSNEEIRFSEEVVQAYEPLPAYARVDAMWDNNGNLAVSEVEMIEPELWFRRNENAAQKLAEVIAERINY